VVVIWSLGGKKLLGRERVTREGRGGIFGLSSRLYSEEVERSTKVERPRCWWCMSLLEEGARKKKKDIPISKQDRRLKASEKQKKRKERKEN